MSTLINSSKLDCTFHRIKLYPNNIHIDNGKRQDIAPKIVVPSKIMAPEGAEVSQEGARRAP